MQGNKQNKQSMTTHIVNKSKKKNIAEEKRGDDVNRNTEP
jgi:hypothetical protein